GFRSPHALQLADGEKAPFTKVASQEIGLTVHLPRDMGSFSLVGFQTNLSQDLTFDAEEGRLEATGPTTRRGLAAYLTGTPQDWLRAAVGAPWVRATYDDPAEPSTETGP